MMTGNWWEMRRSAGNSSPVAGSASTALWPTNAAFCTQHHACEPLLQRHCSDSAAYQVTSTPQNLPQRTRWTGQR